MEQLPWSVMKSCPCQHFDLNVAELEIDPSRDHLSTCWSGTTVNVALFRLEVASWRTWREEQEQLQLNIESKKMKFKLRASRGGRERSAADLLAPTHYSLGGRSTH